MTYSLKPKTYSLKAEKWLFYLFLVSIPFSIRHIFDYSQVGFMEWKAVSLYGTDILLTVLFIFWAIRGKWKINFQKSDWVLVIFVFAAGVSIKNAIDAKIAFFHWIKLIEMAALFWYVRYYVLKRFELSKCFAALVVGGLVQSVIAIPQFMLQHDLGLRYIGESDLSPRMTGIAAFFSDGVKIIRAYGTTVHSNVLAAYLFLSLTVFYFISVYEKRRWFWYIFHAASLWAFLLTFSRAIIAIWAFNFIIRIIFYRFYPGFKKVFWSGQEMRIRGWKIFILTLLVGLAWFAVYHDYALDRLVVNKADETIQLRELYNQEAVSAPAGLFGLGIGNFVPWLTRQSLPTTSIGLPPEQYQPVHNIYLLIYSETGVVGISLFILFLTALFYEFWRRTGFKKPYQFSFTLVFGSLLLFGLFDHFLWTIQSGQILFWLTAGLIASANDKN